jgi:hypothetical protein
LASGFLSKSVVSTDAVGAHSVPKRTERISALAAKVSDAWRSRQLGCYSKRRRAGDAGKAAGALVQPHDAEPPIELRLPSANAFKEPNRLIRAVELTDHTPICVVY